MTGNETIREVAKRRNLKQVEISSKLGVKPNVLSERMRQKNITISKLNEIMKAMDYKIVIVPGDSRLPDGGYEVE